MNDEQLKELLKRKTTPFYIFDLAELQRRIQYLRQALPDHIKLCYAVKANTFVLKEISKFVDRLEICSPGELRICQKLRLPSEKFVISGVYKEPALMNQLISQGKTVGVYTVESTTQFTILYNAAVAAQKQIPILLRLTSGNQFGLDEYEIESIIAAYGNSSFLDIRGIQYFSGTQMTSLKRLKRELDSVDCFIKALRDMHGYQAKELEFGPGLPVSYFQGDSFDEESFLREFSSMLGEIRFRGNITLELGRSIAASCGSYLTQVVDVKCNHSENYAIVDGGMHQLAYYGQSMAMKHPHVRTLQQYTDEQKEEWDVCYVKPLNTDENKLPWNICGSLCTINDILVKKLPLENLQIGDVLVFENTGAYCMTEGISLFLSRNLPEVVLLKEDGSPLTVRGHLQTDTFNIPLFKRRRLLWKD